MAKKLKAVLEASEEDISIADVLNMQDQKVVQSGEDIFESEDEEDKNESEDDDKLDEDGAKLNSGGDETIQESDEEDEKNESEDEDEKNESDDEDDDDVIAEARKILAERKKAKKNESDDEEDKLDEDELNADGAENTNQGKSGTSDTIEQSSDDGNIFEDIENVLKSKDTGSADIFESEEDEDDAKNESEEDEEEKNESEDEDEDEEELDEKMGAAAKHGAKLRARRKAAEKKDAKKALARRAKMKGESEDEEAKDDEVEVDEDDEDDKLDESKTLSEKEQKLVMEALKLPKSSQKEIKVIFESMVANKVKAEKDRLNKKFESRVAKEREQLIEALEMYSKETIKKWKAENKPVFESQARMAKLEESFKKMSELFSELGFQTVLAESAVKNKYSDLVAEHKRILARNAKLEAFVERQHVRDLYEGAIVGMSNNQKRKFVALAESLEYDNVKDLNEKLNTLKKLFIEKKKYESDDVDADKPVDESDENDDNDGTILAKESKSTDLISESLKILSK